MTALSTTVAEAWQLGGGGGSAVAALSAMAAPAWWRHGSGSNIAAAAAWMRHGIGGIGGGAQHDGGSSMAAALRQRRKLSGNVFQLTVKTIISSSFNNIDLLRIMLTDCCVQWRQGRGTMEPVG